jgi:hypothetical protein
MGGAFVTPPDIPKVKESGSPKYYVRCNAEHARTIIDLSSAQVARSSMTCQHAYSAPR